MPAIPHILSALENQLRDLDGRRLDRSSADSFEPIVPIFTRIAFTSVAGGQNNVYHLTSRHKVKCFRSLLGAFDKITEKVLHRRSQHNVPVPGIHPVTLKLDKQPIRSTLHGNRRPLPDSQ